MEFSDIELAKAADMLVREETLLNLKSGEQLLIYADTESDRKVVESTAMAAYVLGAMVTVMWYPAPPDVGEKAVVPRSVTAAMANTDVMVEFSMKSLLFAKPLMEAKAKGVRYLGLWGMDAGMMIRLIRKVNWQKMIVLGKKLVEISEKAKTMRITTSAGTDVGFELGAERPFIRSEVGEGLAGEIAWAPIEETINGKIVLDGSIYPPEIGIIRAPIELEVEKGRVAGIAGGADAKTLERWLASWRDTKMYNIAHFSYSFNPNAKLSSKILEACRVFGSIVVGMGYQKEHYKGSAGPAASHSDGTLQNPSIFMDEECIERDGRYVHPELSEISKALGV